MKVCLAASVLFLSCAACTYSYASSPTTACPSTYKTATIQCTAPIELSFTYPTECPEETDNSVCQFYCGATNPQITFRWGSDSNNPNQILYVNDAWVVQADGADSHNGECTIQYQTK